MMKKILLTCIIVALCNTFQVVAGELPDDTQRRTPVTFVKEQPSPKWMLGAAAGFPTGISGITAVYADPYALRLSSGFSQTGWQGFQTDVSYLVFRYGKSRHDVSLTGGMFKYEEVDVNGATHLENQTYIGSAYTVLYNGFHIQLGFAYGIQDYSHYILLFQAGYMFKLL